MHVSQITLLGPQHFRDMPWKNGGGTTCELYRLPHPKQPEGFALRLSIASVETGGPFSEFVGVDRTLMLLEGAGMRLDMAGTPITLDQALAPLQFTGELPVHCELIHGALRDFNVMVARDWGHTQTSIVHLQEQARHPVALEGLTLVYVVRGTIRVDDVTAKAGELVVVPQHVAAEIVASHASDLIMVLATPV